MKNKTRYTCPFLMRIAKWIYKIKLWRTHEVFWETPTEEGDGAYVVARPRGKKGGFQVRCPFPEWMIFAEMRIRRFFLVLYGWIRYPNAMYASHKKRRTRRN